MSTIGKSFVTIKAVCVHFNVSDNRETMFDAETSRLPDCAVLHVDESNNRESVCDEKTIRVNIHVSDDRETLCGAENSWLPVDVDNKKTLCDDTRGLRACSHER